jgi:predicted component of type VI protein secretion system
MFGTVGRAHISPENRDQLRELMTQDEYLVVPGYRRGYLMFPENRENEVIIVAMFADSDAYWKNADDPAQHERYLQFRALLEDDPEWSDGEWYEGPEGSA